MSRDGTLPEMPPPDLLQTLLGQEWQAAQLAQQHVADVLNKIVEAWRQDRMRVAELEAENLVKKARIAELEAHPVEEGS